MLNQEWFKCVGPQIVIGLDAIFGKTIEYQRRIGWLLICQDFEWRIAIETILKDEGSAPFIASTGYLYPTEVIKEYQSTYAFVELIPRSKQLPETLKVLIRNTVTGVLNSVF